MLSRRAVDLGLLWFGLATLLFLVGVTSGGAVVPALAHALLRATACSGLAFGLWRISAHRSTEPWGMRIFLQNVLGALIFATLLSIASIALSALIDGDSFSAIWIRSHRYLGWDLLMGLLFYGIIAGGCWTIRAREQLRAHTLATAQSMLVALRSQLAPHFLHNALHTITALIREEPQVAEEAIYRLAMLLRYVLQPGDESVPLDDELAFVRAYLGIEQLRFGPRLQVVWQLDEAASSLLVPRCVLQPLVENAVAHGVSSAAQGGRIIVRTMATTSRLELCIVSRAADREGPAWSGHGVGLSNLRARLAAQFGGAATLAAEQGEDGEHRATVVLPRRKQ